MFTIPDQSYAKTIEWARAYAASHNIAVADIYKVIYPNETLSLPAPKGLDPTRWSTLCHYGEAFVAVIPAGRLVTENCYVVTPDNKRLNDVEYYYPYHARDLPPPEYQAGTVATVLWGWNIPEVALTQAIFGHWFFDILPRFHLLEQSKIPIDKYVIGRLTHPFQYESLQMLGIPFEKLIQADKKDFHLIADWMLVPAVPWLLGKSTKWSYHYIRERLKDRQPIQPKSGYERIYVTRKDAFARYILNEDEVMELLRSKGFTRIMLTPLTTQEKVEIYSSAQVVIAPFGSGNINLAFCNPGTKVIELTPYTIVDDYFWKISSHAGLDYYEVVCDIEYPARGIGGMDNFYVDMNKLRQVLSLAGI
ncbi:glycosyltransferase family 61 protein [Paenibacillus alvei]|uniref:Glycosyltransferase family 61 protein n=1 Tax=Paenibacillus alvei TaxID=44250 RepID=A0AAP7DHA9_PAEAL|nr:glycosyltransferase family 61 protein [Paenibacillus alvei]MBG9736828.1 capsular biosynthesis protein [Paenibacillus alvei]MBG9746984.1 capsular biosynthesis protein [Paenibacillus alvei]MCY9582012.1 glycosyltransferase family 61 protein [Paenibacillus alvei]MCY9585910.1 glycosyltransferase family 61 protein [Paenibacillus alvei]NEZ43519.1 DUF563 domain-containing protein [Paenibacillus alvei]